MKICLRHALALATLLGCAAVFGCAASPAMQEPSSMQATAAPPSHEVSSAKTGAAPQMPNVGSTLSLAEHEAAFELAEKKTGFALDGKTELGEPLGTASDRCVVVCKALASMRESATHICRLDESRCVAVKERVERSEKRAKDACPTCASPT